MVGTTIPMHSLTVKCLCCQLEVVHVSHQATAAPQAIADHKLLQPQLNNIRNDKSLAHDPKKSNYETGKFSCLCCSVSFHRAFYYHIRLHVYIHMRTHIYICVCVRFAQYAVSLQLKPPRPSYMHSVAQELIMTLALSNCSN